MMLNIVLQGKEISLTISRNMLNNVIQTITLKLHTTKKLIYILIRKKKEINRSALL